MTSGFIEGIYEVPRNSIHSLALEAKLIAAASAGSNIDY